MSIDVLALVRNSLADAPLWQWLEPGTRLRIIAPPAAVDAAVPEHVDLEQISDYDDSPQVELAALRAFRVRPYSHLVIVSEWDVLRAARLRERLGLPGQHYASATAFRDKALMKDYWVDHRVPTATHARIEVPSDLVAFSDQVGAVVVKPRRAAGSVGVAVLRTPAEVRTWLARNWQVRAGDFSPWIAEEYIIGSMLQIDGVYDNGRIQIAWPTAIDSMLAWQQDTGTPVHAAMLDPDDPTVEAAQALVRRALEALPTPARTPFHAEMWLTGPGESGLLMSEIAARVGGAGTARMIQEGFGVNLHERALRDALYPDLDEPAPARPRASAGFAMIPRRGGRIARVEHRPASLDPSWLPYCSIRVVAGENSPPATNSVDSAALFVATGRSRRQVAERLTQATDWARRAIVYEHEPVANAA